MSLTGSQRGKVYKTGTPVAHKNMTLNPIGYLNREINKGRNLKPSTKRSGLAMMGLERAAQRRLATKQKKKMQRPVRGI